MILDILASTTDNKLVEKPDANKHMPTSKLEKQICIQSLKIFKLTNMFNKRLENSL